MVASNNNHFFQRGLHTTIQLDYYKKITSKIILMSERKDFLLENYKSRKRYFFLLSGLYDTTSYCNKEHKSMIKMKQMELSTIISTSTSKAKQIKGDKIRLIPAFSKNNVLHSKMCNYKWPVNDIHTTFKNLFFFALKYNSGMKFTGIIQ